MGYFTVAELRAEDPEVFSRFSDERIEGMRELVEEAIEDAANIAFLPRADDKDRLAYYDTPPARVRRAGKILARVWLTEGPVTGRATQLESEFGPINLATPGVFGATFGVPEVDETVAAYRRLHTNRGFLA